MVYQGINLSLVELGKGSLELIFNRNLNQHQSSVNLLDQATLAELRLALIQVQAFPNLSGLLISSAKDSFIVGAAITEFQTVFSQSSEHIIALCQQVHQLFNSLEDLACPTVTAINGLALGGGLELALATDFRIMATNAKIGLPETQLGLVPGWGGCVRLPRLIGADNALEWIATGAEYTAAQALNVGAVNAVVTPDLLRDAALNTLQQAQTGWLDWQAQRHPKLHALRLNQIESLMVFESAKAKVASQAGPHYPAPLEVVALVQASAQQERAAAQQTEANSLAKLAKTSVSQQLIGIFLNNQYLKKLAASYTNKAKNIHKVAVLGAGIMGSGITYQTAISGLPVVLQDINASALHKGWHHLANLLAKQQERQRITQAQLLDSLGLVNTSLTLTELDQVDLCIEAVVERADIKVQALAAAEAQLNPKAILASNTSTLSITNLSQHLHRPENFCGLHFFNPVQLMPLVEVIRGAATSATTLATAVSYVKKIGKTPIVVKDCPGFLVNRILFPYFNAFNLLMREGGNYQQIDKFMQTMGWPMGPAQLLDVVGLDTANHASAILAAGYPDRMQLTQPNVLELMYNAGYLGQKNALGFYSYLPNKQDTSRLHPSPLDTNQAAQLQQILQPLLLNNPTANQFTKEQIIARLLVPLCLEAVRCLEEGVVASATEIDMALIYGLGLPPYLGGALRYIDALGVANFVALADSYAYLGPLYQATEQLRHMAKHKRSFYPQEQQPTNNLS